VSRRSQQRLADIAAAIAAIHGHLERGDLSDGLVYDAVRARLIEIGEAVKHIDPPLLDSESSVDWRGIAGMRDFLAHRYFDTEHAVVQHAVSVELPLLGAAIERIVEQA